MAPSAERVGHRAPRRAEPRHARGARVRGGLREPGRAAVEQRSPQRGRGQEDDGGTGPAGGPREAAAEARGGADLRLRGGQRRDPPGARRRRRGRWRARADATLRGLRGEPVWRAAAREAGQGPAHLRGRRQEFRGDRAEARAQHSEAPVVGAAAGPEADVRWPGRGAGVRAPARGRQGGGVLPRRRRPASHPGAGSGRAGA
mmetsp:Transcript_107559/g.291567  ORF Transcript_107559/g.291567 Transcript_107559/m.291567 type:complete len:202 (-) Transcript_107559:639-1244(-)